MKRKWIRAGAALAAGLLALSLCACSGEKEAASGEKNVSGESSAAAVTGSPAGKAKETAAEKAKGKEKETEAEKETTEAEEEWPELFESPMNKWLYGYAAAGDGWIYYRSGDEDRYSLNRMRPDGSDEQELFSYGYREISYITVEDGWVYFRAEPYLYKMRADGSDRTQLVESMYAGVGTPLLVHDGWVYYTDYEKNEETGLYDFGIYRVKTDGSDASKVISVLYRGTNNYCIVDDYLYYDCEVADEKCYAFYRANLDGSNPERLCAVEYTGIGYPFFWWTDGTDIHISDSHTEKCLRKINISTGEMTEYKYESGDETVIDRWLYFREGDEALFPLVADGPYMLDRNERARDVRVSVVGDWAFYRKGSRNQMYRIPVGGTDYEALTEDRTEN